MDRIRTDISTNDFHGSRRSGRAARRPGRRAALLVAGLAALGAASYLVRRRNRARDARLTALPPVAPVAPALRDEPLGYVPRPTESPRNPVPGF